VTEAAVTGLAAVGTLSSVLVWGETVTSQTPGWQAVSDSQTPAWTSVNDTNTVVWTAIPT